MTRRAVFDRQVELRSFAEVSALAPIGPGQFEAAVDSQWTIGGKPNGGYLLAVLGRAAVAVGPHEHVIAASAHYLHSPDPGPVVVEAEVLRSGRSASQVHARMLQDGQPCVEALLTTSRLDPAAEPHWGAGAPTPGTSRYQESIHLPGVTPTGVPVSLAEQVDVRIDPDSFGFSQGRPSGRGELRGWLALPHSEPFDPVSLLFAVDAFPPATFDIEMTGWVPTLELTVYVRALPAPGPVRVLQKANVIDAQRVDETCWVWDSRGRVVAHGTQLAGIRLG